MKLINLFFLLFLPSMFCERILLLTPLGSKSHKIFFMGIAEALAKRNHQVTMVSAFEPTKQIKNIREVKMTYDMDYMMKNAFSNADDVITKLLLDAPTVCADTLGQKQVQELRKEKFDLVMLSMFFDYCYLSFVHDLQVPFIYMSPAGLFGPFSDMMGNIEFPSFVPNKLIEAKFPLTFKERAISTLLNMALGAVGPLYMDRTMRNVCIERGLCSPDMPSLMEMHKNASLAIINSVRALEAPPRPMMPNIIYAGGAHIKPAKKLPQEIEDWIQGSGNDGFIFFSLGSALNPSLLPENYRKILVKVFGSLKQRVLWKWNEESMPDLPPNVKLGKWLPQQDILGHPKLKLFITHGGLLSTLESTYNGIPIVGMPIFADQFSNMKDAEKEGWAKVMNWKELEEETFKNIIISTMNDERIKEISKHRAALMRDVPIPPSEEAVFWVEYVLRHKGAPHIMSPVRYMRWYEVYNIDVWLLVAAIILGLLYLEWLIFKCFLRSCCGLCLDKKSKRKRE